MFLFASLQELECGVQLEGSDTAKHEWSFTLYDFDGHGRITKEDLSSLLKALYDAVGSSIKLPPNGAKTLKLRLSVGQDGGAANLQQVAPGRVLDVGCSGDNNNSNCHTDKNNFNNVTTSKRNNIVSGTSQTATFAARVSERSRNTARAPKNKVREFSKLNNLTRAAGAEQKQQKQHLVKRTNEHRGQQARLASLASAVQLAPPPSVCSAARDSGLFLPAPLAAEVNKTVGSDIPEHKEATELLADNQAEVPTEHALSDHQLLADLVQENMERNKVRQQLRRLSEHQPDESHRSPHHHHHHHHHHPHHSYQSRHHRRRHQRAAAATSSSQRHNQEASTHQGVSAATGVCVAFQDREHSPGEVRAIKLGNSRLDHWWTRRKTFSKGFHKGDTEEEDNVEDGEKSHGCIKACGVICRCRQDNFEKQEKSTETKERKLFVSLKEEITERSKGDEGVMSRLKEGRAEESQDRRNYYLDLAGVENTSSRFQSNHQSPNNRPGCSRRYHKGHHRSRSHDLATAHVTTTGANIKFSNVITGNKAGRCGSLQPKDTSDFHNAGDQSSCLCKPNCSAKCDNLLFSAVAFGLSLASEAPHVREKCDNSGGPNTEHVTVGNSFVRMLTTSSTTEPQEYHHHGRSKSYDPHVAAGISGNLGRRGQRSQKQSQQTVDQQLQNSSSSKMALAAAASGLGEAAALSATNTKMNSLNFTLNSSSSTTTNTTDNNVSNSDPRGRRFRPLSLPGHVPASVSPHHHRRHRHRDKDHSQAMQQVAQWIEREQHAWDQDASTGTGAAAASGEEHILVQRHEHHHIHEHHHHHHYHHYHET
ncbi:naked cuticle protein [Elysia marginata]|uniref:Protein naked cuticle homolog n=1 Tax=Elysia marginata TaxID=1093978 RepID=A0AAV4JJV1_9GAST|nr:naked cuticle protein [Elysia marginata]